MNTWIGLIPAFPLCGFFLLALFGDRLSKPAAALVGCGSVGASALVSLAAAVRFSGEASSSRFVWWNWMSTPGFSAGAAVYVDSLTIVMLCTVTFVGFLIHLYSAEFMFSSEGYSRYFAYMNLFVAAMTVLVSADNLVFLLLGWEGVGLCSYLLIGFWYENPVNTRAAQKAFIVTRVGDTALLIGLFLLFKHFHTLDMQHLLQLASAPRGDTLTAAAALLLLGGAIGKSAQVPLQVWLPDAMAGPSPVSALIHAATMVTAGVYLVARMHPLFVLAPDVQFAAGALGAVTLLLAACSAFVAVDLKRVLAYSTISQVGFMFLAIGAGAWAAAIFHLVTHAFFKSLLFLAGGVVIEALHHEGNIFRMGGLRKTMPFTFWTFLAGAASLAGLPFLTAGFYSKELILTGAAVHSGTLFYCGLLGSFLTAAYSFRLVFLVFFGRPQTHAVEGTGLLIRAPLVVLAALALGAGILQASGSLGPGRSLISLLQTSLPALPAHAPSHAMHLSLLAFPVAGILLSCWLYLLAPKLPENVLASSSGARRLRKFWLAGWGFDRIYDLVLVRPVVWAAKSNKSDAIDFFYQHLQLCTVKLHVALSHTQKGLLPDYVAAVLAGAVVIVGIMVFL